jgi:hypothetical protein
MLILRSRFLSTFYTAIILFMEDPNTPGKEYVQPNEHVYIEKIIQAFKHVLPEYYPAGKVKRMFHPKMHGLVQASFNIADDLEEKYQQGLFQPGMQYPCWIRFSNAKKKPQADKKKDMRGIAIKLIGVPGKKLLEQHPDDVTQDFLCVTAKTLQTRSVHDFQKSLSALMSGGLKLVWYALTHPCVVIRSIKQISKCSNLLETSFFSTTPYRFGKNENVAVKYAVIPQKKHSTLPPANPSDNFLKEQLIQDLSNEDFYFDFMIQFQENAAIMPIEDPTVEWSSPFIKVASIKIPKQIFNSAAQISYGENLSFTPWHCINEHQPLGGVNRARKAVYIALSAFRHELNVKIEKEPAAMESFN